MTVRRVDFDIPGSGRGESVDLHPGVALIKTLVQPSPFSGCVYLAQVTGGPHVIDPAAATAVTAVVGLGWIDVIPGSRDLSKS